MKHDTLGTDGADGAHSPAPTDEPGPTSCLPAAGPGAGLPVTGGPRRRPHTVRLAVICVVLMGAFGYLLLKGLGNSLNYFDTVDQAVHQRATLGTQTFRMEGVVLPGDRQAGGDVYFTIEANGVEAQVVNQGSPPQLFQPNIPVVVVGHFEPGSETFLSDQIMVKHSSSYVAANPQNIKKAYQQAAAVETQERGGALNGTATTSPRRATTPATGAGRTAVTGSPGGVAAGSTTTGP